MRTTTAAIVAGLAPRLARPAPLSGIERERARDYGAREVRLGRNLVDLLGAYRVAARTAWHHVVARTGPGDDLAVLAEAVFGYFDALDGATVEGFADEQAARAGAGALHRERLVELLARDPPADAATLTAAAHAARWEPPAQVYALVLRAERPPALPPGSIAAVRGELVFAVVPASAAAAAAQRDPTAIAGPPVAWPLAALSFRRALRALELRDAGVLPEAAHRTEDHRLALFLHADPELARDLAREHLAALDGLAPAKRRALKATLAAWLAHQGHQGAVGHALGIHQQTVRYRLARLRELLGDALDDPDKRLALTLALRVQLPVDTRG